MATNWRVHKTLSFILIGVTIAALLGFAINLEDKIFNFISWKWIIVIGQGYVAWVFKNLLNY